MKTTINILKWYLVGIAMSLTIVSATYALDYVSIGFVKYAELHNLFLSCLTSGIFFGVSAWAFYQLFFNKVTN